MAHIDLYGVTASLRKLLRVNLWRLSGQNIKITAITPEEAEKESTTCLNLHLYHAIEDPSRRNAFPPDDGGGDYPISRVPLPLTLYYALTAHAKSSELSDPVAQQFLMGMGMKSLHDFPVIDDALLLPGPPSGTPVQILQPAMRGAQNRIEIAPKPTTPEETVNFWSSAQNHTARLTAYYEVRSLLMPPEASTAKPGIVLALGLGVSGSGRPTLASSASTQSVTLPALSGGATLSNEATPAVAALGATAAPPGNRVTLAGEALGDGTSERLLLSSPGFASADPIVIDPAANPAWRILFRGNSVEFDVQPVVNAEAPVSFVAVPIRPGTYAAAVRRLQTLVTESGATSVTAADSNSTPFAIGPRIAGAAIVAGRVRFTLASGVDTTDPKNKPQLSIGGEVYRFVSAFIGTPAADAGSFIAPSPTRYEAQPHFDPADGATRIVRIAVNGVDAPPIWLEP